jgi:hypothetical protein
MAGLVDSRDDSRGLDTFSPDDLNAPLGQDKKKRLPELPANAPQLLAARRCSACLGWRWPLGAFSPTIR